MNQRTIGKALAVAVILLFLGLAIQPSVAVQPNTFNVEDDCNLCAKKVSKYHLVLIRSLLNRLEKYDNLLSVLSKDNPKFEERYQELSYTITNLKDDLDGGYPIICTILVIISVPFLILLYIAIIGHLFFKIDFIIDLASTLLVIVEPIAKNLYDLYNKFNCHLEV